jgi:septal ring factor EnvC (AmiA/AmiB activator)
MKFQFFFPALVLACAAIPKAHAAEPLLDAIQSQVESNRTSAEAQKSIDNLNDQTRRMLEEYRDALRRAEALDAYNAHLRRLVASQEAEKESLEKQLGEIESTRRDLVPLMLRMVEALDRFVQLDKPFLPEERARRMAELKALMNRADVTDAEKFRRVLDAYRIENDYGKTIETYRAELGNGDTNVRTVDFLRIGRVALLYQSLDGKETGVWNNQSGHWQTLPADYNAPVRQGLAVARKESPPELLTIAVEAPEAAR